MTWPLSNQVTLDEDESWGYSCLSMIDKETVGIFYESSVAHMTFQAIRLTDLVLHETHTLHIDKFIYRDIGCTGSQYPSFASMAAESGMEREKVSI